MITDDKQFHACRVCILDKLIGIHRVYALRYLRKRNAAFHTLRSLLLETDVSPPCTVASYYAYMCKLTLTFLHTHLVEKIQFGNAQTAVSNMQTTVTTCYSLFGYVTCRWSTPHRRVVYRSFNIEMVVINHWGLTAILVRTYSITIEYYFDRC